MEIRWLGHACFTITHKGYTLAIDPYNSDYVVGYPKLRGLKADKLLISHEAPQVELQEVAVHLHLLQPEAPEGAQPHALQQRLQADLDDAGQHRHLWTGTRGCRAATAGAGEGY